MYLGLCSFTAEGANGELAENPLLVGLKSSSKGAQFPANYFQCHYAPRPMLTHYKLNISLFVKPRQKFPLKMRNMTLTLEHSICTFLLLLFIFFFVNRFLPH